MANNYAIVRHQKRYGPSQVDGIWEENIRSIPCKNVDENRSHLNFTVEILKEFKNIAPTTLGNIEMQYIARMDPHYNISPGGELGHYKTDIKKAG